MKKKFTRLSSRLIRVIIILNFALILFVVTIQIFYRYKREIAEINSQINYVEKSYLPLIASELYKIDKDQLTLLINSILQNKSFEYVEIIETTGQNDFQLSSGAIKSRYGVYKTFDLNFTRPDSRTLLLGKFKIFAGYNGIVEHLRTDTLILLGTSSLFIFLFSFLILILFQFLVSRHLISLANYASNININYLTHNLKLNRKQRKTCDELDQVVSAINNLEIRLKQGIEDREITDQALIKSEYQLSLIFNTVSDYIALFRIENNDLLLETVNANFVKIYTRLGVDFKLEDLINKSFKHIVTDVLQLSDEILAHFSEKTAKCIAGKNEIIYENSYIFPLGTIFLSNLLTPVIDQDGNCTHVLYIARNITERKLSEMQVLNAVIKTEEQEKSRFAKEIHDGLGPILSTAKLYIQTLKDEKSEKNRKETLKRVFSTLEEALISIKEISNNLSPHILQNFGLTKALQTFINKIVQNQEIKIDFKSKQEERYNHIVETTFYRVIIELINNTLKHAEAELIKIKIEQKPDRLQFTYTDNGKGFEVEKVLNEHKGFGLYNMQNRFATLNGQIVISSGKNKGICVEGFLPLDDKPI